MTDAELVAKRLVLLESYVADLKREADPDALDADLLQRRFVEHTLQLAIQCALDAASHIVAAERLGEPQTNRALFQLLARGRWLEGQLADQLSLMAGFRNILVHGYAEVDLEVVRDVLANRLQDLLEFARAIRARLR